MWVKGTKGMYSLTAETLEEAVHELAQHEEYVFEYCLPLFKEAREIVRRYASCSFSTYSEYQEVELARMGRVVKPCDRASRQIAELFASDAAVVMRSPSDAPSHGREGYSALEEDVCPSKTIGCLSGAPQASVS